MTVRDELVGELAYLLEARADYDRCKTQSHWNTLSDSAHRFLRDHGPALVEALEDGARGKWVIDNAAWIRRDGVTVMEITLPEGVNLSSWGCRRDAIDRARGGE